MDRLEIDLLAKRWNLEAGLGHELEASEQVRAIELLPNHGYKLVHGYWFGTSDEDLEKLGRRVESESLRPLSKRTAARLHLDASGFAYVHGEGWRRRGNQLEPIAGELEVAP